MTSERINDLTDRFFADACTAEEIEELARWVDEAGDDEPLKIVLGTAWLKHQPVREMPEEMSERILASVFAKREEVTRVRSINSWRRAMRRITVAASILLVIGGGGYFLFFHKGVKPGELVKTTTLQDVQAPQTNRATIVLSGGQRVFLDSIAGGTLAVQGNVQIKKLNDGQIAYTGSGTEMTYNTLFNPRGSRLVTLTLSDGTKVWLNAESSLRYPTAFNGKDRKVEITGEAYFEVAQDPAKPFVVSRNNTAVTVLGTRFNVNAYGDEPVIKITLVEGAVRVEADRQQLLLRPGEQAVKASSLRLNKSPNIRQVLAWKEGAFDFTGLDFAGSMRQLERWYDIKVVYDGPAPTGGIGGKIGRDLTLMQVLKGIQGMGAHYKLEGKVLHVMLAL